jgi:hypothetical protein
MTFSLAGCEGTDGKVEPGTSGLPHYSVTLRPGGHSIDVTPGGAYLL